MGQWIRSIKGRSIKTQWYVLYCVVLIIPMLTMLFSYRYAYEQLAETVYDRQMAHLTLVRDLVDTEARELSNAMMAFGVDSQIREAVKIKDPAAEGKMPLFRSIIKDVTSASLNRSLVAYFSLYFPESEYLLDDRYLIPRRVISWDGYDGTIGEAECAAILENARTGSPDLLVTDSGIPIIYMKLSVYGSTKPLYAAAVLSTSEMARLLGSDAEGTESVISLVDEDGVVCLSNDPALAEVSRQQAGEWFQAEVASEVLPVRYVYASPTRIVEEKLTAYRCITLLLVFLSLALGTGAIYFAVRRQYAPLEQLMQHFSAGDDQMQNEYQNISDYLLQAQERNEHHFMVDMLQGHLSHADGFSWRQLLLLSPQDAETVLPLSDMEDGDLSHCRVVPIFGHVVCIFQHEQYTPDQIARFVSRKFPGIPVYMVYSLCVGQSLHRAYSDAQDVLTTLRFFQAPVDQVYTMHPSEKDAPICILSTSFDEELRTAILMRQEEKAQRLMQTALQNIHDSCTSGNRLRSSLYAISVLFMRLEAAVCAQNPAIPDGVAGDIVRSYRYTTMEQLQQGAYQAIHDMINALELQNTRRVNTLYDQISAYIHENYSNPDLSVDMIADHMNFSAVYIRRIFKQGGGMGIPDLILRLRIDAAKQKLQEPGSKVNDVAQQVGFVDTGTFIRSFKKVEGMTPGAYKAQHQLQINAEIHGDDEITGE